jgi:hypothetical protein
MAFLEDPRLRQRWNQISHNAETVTENAAAGIWSFQHNYLNPCFSSIADSFDHCTTVCLGDPEERARKRRERERAQGRAEYSFDFYDDWDAEEESGGILGGWSNEDWDRLLAGTGSHRRQGAGEVIDQPKRKRGMSYGTRGVRRKTSEQDPTIIPSTQPIGFLGKLPWKIGGTLRYKPSAADLQDHPGRHEQMGETEPLLGTDSEDEYVAPRPAAARKRSGTTGSGDTSDSYRSRGDIFPSDGEGEEDAVPLDDEFTHALARVDDRSSSRTKSSKGKRPAGGMSRTVSRVTIDSTYSRRSLSGRIGSGSIPGTPDIISEPSLEDLRQEELQIEREEGEEIARKRDAAAQLATERGLGETAEFGGEDSVPETEEGIDEIETKQDHSTEVVDVHTDGLDGSQLEDSQLAESGFLDDSRLEELNLEDPHIEESDTEESHPDGKSLSEQDEQDDSGVSLPDYEFVPARLPNFR